MNLRKLFATLFLLLLAITLTGCGDLTGRGAAPLDDTVNAALRAKHPRVGYVYCMRGWLGVFSEGMDALANKIDTQVGTPAVSVANEEWPRLREWLVANHAQMKEGPLVLLGHSYGADDMIRTAKYLQTQNISVDLLVLIDPVTPPPIPTNVKRAYCVYKSNPTTDWYPAWRGVPIEVVDEHATPYINIDLRVTDVGFNTTALVHPTIDKSEGIHNLCMEQIRQVCLTKEAWAQQHPASSTVGVIAPSPPAR